MMILEPDNFQESDLFKYIHRTNFEFIKHPKDESRILEEITIISDLIDNFANISLEQQLIRIAQLVIFLFRKSRAAVHCSSIVEPIMAIIISYSRVSDNETLKRLGFKFNPCELWIFNYQRMFVNPNITIAEVLTLINS